MQTIEDADTRRVQDWLNHTPDTQSVAGFVPGPGIERLDLSFDIQKLREALEICLTRTEFKGDLEAGFGAFSLTRRPGVEKETANDLSATNPRACISTVPTLRLCSPKRETSPGISLCFGWLAETWS